MNKKELFSYIKSYAPLANPSLGQNFLINESVANKVIDALDAKKEDKVLEIGAGLGSLSILLSETNASLTLLDIDKRMIDFLSETFVGKKNIKIVNNDVLKHDVSGYTKIVGNLPYYITSDILEYVLLNAKKAKKMVFMIQKEAFERLLKIDKKEISPLTIILSYLTNVEAIMEVDAKSFVPIPKVESIVFSLTKKDNVNEENLKETYLLMKKLFIYRRKTIINNLTYLVGDKCKAKECLNEAKIFDKLRPDKIKIEEYFSLANILSLEGIKVDIN